VEESIRHILVLKKMVAFPQTYVVFDRYHGKKIINVYDVQLIVGYIYEYRDYSIQYHNKKVVINKYNSELVAQPVPWLIDQLTFFHHVLELLDAMLWEGQEAPELFDWCFLLYQISEKPICIHSFEYLFLNKMLWLMGMTPHDLSSYQSFAISLICLPCQGMLGMRLDASLLLLMERWFNESRMHNGMVHEKDIDSRVI
jgi:hypothetical protein